jgi:hypothetical protein
MRFSLQVVNRSSKRRQARGARKRQHRQPGVMVPVIRRKVGNRYRLPGATVVHLPVVAVARGIRMVNQQPIKVRARITHQ